MFGFDKMFDFNCDGRLDTFERAAQFQFMDNMMKSGESDLFDDDEICSMMMTSKMSLLKQGLITMS